MLNWPQMPQRDRLGSLHRYLTASHQVFMEAKKDKSFQPTALFNFCETLKAQSPALMAMRRRSLLSCWSRVPVYSSGADTGWTS